MPEHDGLMRIFWPADIPKSDRPGVIVGWRNSGLDLFVIAILEDVDPRNVESALKLGTLFRGAKHSISRIYALCGQGSMQILGLSNRPDAEVENLQVHAVVTQTSKMPQISCARASTIQIIMFNRPLPYNMQYISLNPISLALGDKAERTFLPPGSVDAQEEMMEQKSLAKRQELVQKLKLHTVTKHNASQKDLALTRIVNQVNCCYELHELLQKNLSLVGRRPRRTLSVSERVVESATTMRDYVIMITWQIITLYIYPVIRRGFVIALLMHRFVAEILLTILEWRPRPDYAALKDVSATAQQVEIRLQQFCYWPMQYVTLRKRKEDWESVTTSHPEYIRFYNSLWLVANDVIIGIALGSYIIENAGRVADTISDILSLYSVAALQRRIAWLMGYPAGLKLNNELAAFLGDLFLWVIDHWSNCIEMLHPILPQIVWVIGFSSFAGASMPIALFSDLLSILTLHIYSFYLASARIFNWQYTILLSLFQLFRGKKHNVLRKRIDSCDYDLDQLLLGTILFTLLFFLLPTVVVFYLTFALSRMAIISLKAALDTLLSCLNHFPLFALMLRLKDSQRLPGGIRFALMTPSTLPSRPPGTHPQIPTPPTSYISLTSVPLTFRAMFHQYFQLGHRIRSHYLSPRVLLGLATGQFVPPIHRKNLYSLQYSMLPARRIGVWDMWRALTVDDDVGDGKGKGLRTVYEVGGRNGGMGRRVNSGFRGRYGH